VTDTNRRIRIDAIGFTGPQRKPTMLSFKDGANIIWGASSSGKSFVRKSIDYVLGGEKPSLPPEGQGYDNYILWLTLPNDRKISLRCSAHGSDIYKVDGHSLQTSLSFPGYQVLLRKHVGAQNISRFLLTEVGFRDAQLLKNERAEKMPFSLRLLMRYLIIDETRMIDEKSILLSHSTTVTSEDKGLIKFLLTGVDGSSIEQVRSSNELKAARDGKIEILSQMADEARLSIDDTLDIDQVRGNLIESEVVRDNYLSILADRQSVLDGLNTELRAMDRESRHLENRLSELRLLIVRFAELRAIYESDIERLRGLEEGGFLLQRFVSAQCPLCGAAPADQTHNHGLAHVEDQRQAVEAEIEKIEAESLELVWAIGSAQEELAAVRQSLEDIAERRLSVSEAQESARVQELSARQFFVTSSATVKGIETDLAARQNLLKLEAQIERLRRESPRSRQRADGIDVNLDLTQHEAHGLALAVKKVLNAWNYPGALDLHFATDEYDIVVDGKRRRDNGAGVRALLHAAFKVGLFEYCLEHRRPHPGFLIMDSPLLAYRPAEVGSRYGELTDDEIALQRADVASHFYLHLQSLSDRAQFIVIENHKDDQNVVKPYLNYQFTRNPSIGRAGLFI
jgi:hypothetical protein